MKLPKFKAPKIRMPKVNLPKPPKAVRVVIKNQQGLQTRST